jgi:hypothetical protein
MVWYGMTFHAMPCLSLPWYRMVRYGMPFLAMVWYGMPFHAMPSLSLPWYGMNFHAMPCLSLSWYGMVWYDLGVYWWPPTYSNQILLFVLRSTCSYVLICNCGFYTYGVV